ncbi:MAG: hypothetical protein HQK98_06895 [Nitrospirae bacterium]|nr:hypothetical protein [Nitrospirota bacterium]
MDHLSFLEYAWSKIGLPEQLLADKGALNSGLASSEFLKELGIALPQMMPYKKEGHGKIERVWETM